MGERPLPLAGLRVLDLSRVLAGPYCTMLLGDLGADVVKIEQPGSGDETRSWGPPFAATESAYYLAVNRNKRSIAVNLKDPDGREIVRRLAEQSDVLVENFRIGTLERLGLGYDALRGLNPGLIFASITAFGSQGPYRDDPGYDFTVQALGGLMSITGETDGEPMKVGVAIVDVSAALYLTTAILAALHAREQTGQGQRVEVSLLESQLAWLINVASNYLVSGAVPKRYGNAHPNIVPYQAFRARGRSLVVAIGNDRQFAALCQVLGEPGLAADPRFATNVARVRHRTELIPLLASRFAERDAEEWVTLLREHDIPTAPINTLDRTFADPQVQALRVVAEVPHPTAGHVRLVRAPFQFDGAPLPIRRHPPLLGKDTDTLLRDLLGYDAARIAELRRRGAIG